MSKKNITNKTEKKNEKAKKPKQKLSSVLKNNLFILKLIHKSSPGYIFLYLFNTCFWAVINFVNNSFMLRYIMNGVQTGMAFSQISIFIIIMLVIELLGIVYERSMWNIIFPRFKIKINAGIDKLVFEKSKSVELACYEDSKFYDKYIKATDAAGNKPYDVLQSLDMLLYSILNISLNTFLIFLIEPIIVLFALIPLIASLADRKRKKLRYNRNMDRKPIERRTKYTRRTFYLNEYAKEMRLFDMYRVMFKQFGEAVRDHIEISKKYGLKIGFLGLIKSVATDVLSVLGATAYMAYQALVMKSILTGDAFVVINSLSNITWTLQNTASTLLEFGEHSLYIENLREFLSYEPKLADGQLDAGHGDLDLHNISFRYEGSEVDVLSDVNMHIGHGEKIALVGQNGAGKSTLVKLMLRLYDPTSGDIEYAGHEIKEYKLDSYRQGFSVVFQDFRVFSLSVSENILLRRLHEGDSELVREAAEKSGALKKIDSLKNGFDTVLTREFDDKGEILSGGEYQKLQLARVFAENSDIVILDEPSSALDPIAEYKMYENMLEACRDRSLVFISHRLSSAVLADRIYMLEHGKIIECGTHTELMNLNGKYADMFRKQAANYV